MTHVELHTLEAHAFHLECLGWVVPLVVLLLAMRLVTIWDASMTVPIQAARTLTHLVTSSQTLDFVPNWRKFSTSWWESSWDAILNYASDSCFFRYRGPNNPIRINYYSNPNLRIQNVPMGNAENNCARRIQENARAFASIGSDTNSCGMKND